MSVALNKYWKRYVMGPGDMARPSPGQMKGYFIIKRYFNHDLDDIWVRISWATKCGALGYYSGYSNDSQVVFVHIAGPLKQNNIEMIRGNLRIAGANNIKFYSMPVDDQEDDQSEEEENTLAQFEQLAL